MVTTWHGIFDQILNAQNRGDWEEVLQLSMKLCNNYELPVPHFLYKEEDPKIVSDWRLQIKK